MKTLIVISSKSPNPHIIKCIQQLYDIQIDDVNNTKICIVDSNSNDIENYKNIINLFPFVEIHLVRNMNYEYGAWKYAHSIYPDYDIYFCIQDTNIIHKKLDYNIIGNNNVYAFHHHSGFNSHLSIKQLGIHVLDKSDLDYKSIIDTDFNLAQHSSFIVNNHVMKDIFKTLVNPPNNKDGSCCYERLFGIYFILKNIQMHNLYDYFTKIHGQRV